MPSTQNAAKTKRDRARIAQLCRELGGLIDDNPHVKGHAVRGLIRYVFTSFQADLLSPQGVPDPFEPTRPTRRKRTTAKRRKRK